MLIVFVGSNAFHVTRLNGRDWGISLALGVISLPLGAAIRCIPNAPVERFINMLGRVFNPILRKMRILKKKKEVDVPATVTHSNWNETIMAMRDNLQTFSSVRGGRMRGSSFVGRSRKAKVVELEGMEGEKPVEKVEDDKKPGLL